MILLLPLKVTQVRFFSQLFHFYSISTGHRYGPAGSPVTDAGLVHLKGLTDLQTLDLSETKATDAGLEHLKGLTELRTLDVSKTNVTYEGGKKLHQVLPKCHIYPFPLYDPYNSRCMRCLNLP